MEINKITLQNNLRKENKNHTSFKGAGAIATTALNFLDTNQAWGANFVDFAFMVTPRTTVDFTRGVDAGLETGRREASGTTNHALLGVYGLLAGAMMSIPFNHKYGVNAHRIFAGNDAIDLYGNIWQNELKELKATDLKDNAGKDISKEHAVTKKFLNKVFSGIEGYNNSWNSIKDKDKDKIVEKFTSELVENKKFSKEGRHYIESMITTSTGAENMLRVKANGKTIENATVKGLLDDIYSVGKAFQTKNVMKVFEEAKDFDANVFLKGLKKLNIKRSALGIAVGAGIGMCIQPLNMYLTKKKTGSDGFVGVEGRKKDNTKGFLALKIGAATAFGALTKKILGCKFKDIPQAIQFKGMSPTINQLKLVYGLTIMSRLLAARDKDELREASIKDTLGYLNWLVLGGIVTKFVAKAYDKNGSLLNNPSGENGFKGLLKSNVKTRREILMKELGEKAFENGKALSLSDMMKKVAKDSSIRKTLKHSTVAQLAGYVYSGAVLGWGVPKLNIAITNFVNKRRNEKKKEECFSDTNVQFLNKKNDMKVNLKNK